jgi:hypothetical protein
LVAVVPLSVILSMSVAGLELLDNRHVPWVAILEWNWSTKHMLKTESRTR